MSADTLTLLLCTNGTPPSLPALDYGVWLAEQLKAEVALLGIVERASWESRVQEALDFAAKRLEGAGLRHQVILRHGKSEQVIRELSVREQQITVAGPLGRAVWERAVRGRSFRRLLDSIATPLLYTRSARLQMKRILICMGGLGYELTAESLVIRIARQLGAAVTFLHVVSPITYDYPVAREMQAHADNILESNTLLARNLQAALDQSRQNGVEAEFKTRHGPVVHEIAEELNKKEYDLVAMGSMYSAHGLRHLVTPNVTAEIAEMIDRPLLTVRGR